MFHIHSGGSFLVVSSLHCLLVTTESTNPSDSRSFFLPRFTGLVEYKLEVNNDAKNGKETRQLCNVIQHTSIVTVTLSFTNGELVTELALIPGARSD